MNDVNYSGPSPDVPYLPPAGGRPAQVYIGRGQAGTPVIPANAPDPFAGFPDAPAQSAAASQGAPSGDPWAAFPDKPPEAAKTSSRDVGTGEAAFRGLAESSTFGLAPAIAGLANASGIPAAQPGPGEQPGGIDVNPVRPIVGAANLLHTWLSDHPDETVRDAYNKGREAALADQNLAQQQHPAVYLAGQLSGALATPAMGILRGASAGGRILGGLQAGGIAGGLYGAGGAISEDQSPGNVLTSAAAGAATGAAFGAGGSGLLEAGGAVASKVGSLYRGHTNVDAEASRRIVNSLQSDFAQGGQALSPEETAAANAAGTPRSIVDFGGERTRALARSSANTSPEARRALTEMTQQRFEQQSPRVAGFIRQLTPGANAFADREALESASRQANRPAYAKAYAAGDRPIWSPQLERLTGSPSIRQAIGNAVTGGQDRAINDGLGAFRPSAKVTQDGRLLFNKGPTGTPTYPNLQFWDYVQRELRDMSSVLHRAGRNEEGGALTGLHKQLRGELDRLVPEFGRARDTASAFFGAENALEAGQKFVMSNANITEAKHALGKMSPAERELFARGFASDLADKIERMGDNRNALNSIFINSGAARQKIETALGPSRARQLEAMLRAEHIVDQARRALGNSTTARQLAEMGLAGGAVAAFEGFKEHSVDPTHVIAGALTLGAIRHGAKRIDEKVARRVGELLASNDPTAIARGIKIISASPVMFNLLRFATSAGSRIAAHDIGPRRALTGAGVGLGRMFGGDE
jgi:hypothetical protein